MAIKTKRFKDFKNSWSNKDNQTNLNIASDKISDMIKETPYLNWLEEKGYGVRFSKGQDFNDGANYDTMGQQGALYTFYLYKQATDEIIRDYLINNGEIKNVDEVVEYFGDRIRKEIGDNNFDSVDFEPFNVDEEDNLIFDEKTEIKVYSDSYGEDLPHWNAMVPLYDSGKNHRKICEFGLFRARWELLKLIKITGSKGVRTLFDKISYFQEYHISGRSGSDEQLVEYMNMSDVHMTKNEDLEKAIDTKYMLYKTHKLLDEIATHDNFFEIPIEILEEFVRLPNQKMID